VEAQLMLVVAPPDSGPGPDGSADGGDSGCRFELPVNLTELNTVAWDWDPAVSADGLTLYFASDRAGGLGGVDIWRAARPDPASPFAAAQNLTEVNSADYDWGPAISVDGLTLYFTSDRFGGIFDIWCALRPDLASAFEAAMELIEVNSAADDVDPAISADDLTLYFGSTRPLGAGAFDVWRSVRSGPSDAFGTPQNVAEANSADQDSDPAVSADGLTLFFASDRIGTAFDLFSAERSDLASPFGELTELFAVNSAVGDLSPSISTDGLTLYFASERAGAGGYDLWSAVRSCP
jgi:hypothetical protein